MPPKRIVIIANGDLNELGFYHSLIKAGDLVYCVNGGTRHALALGLEPFMVIGDLDSLDPGDRQKLNSLGPRIVEHPAQKDKSDLELALDQAVEAGPGEIIIIGALGGERADHAFINVLLLHKPLRYDIPAAMIDERHVIMLADKEIDIEGTIGDYVSIFSLTAESGGIATEGLKYPLKDETLYFASTRGLSNELVAPRARIKLKSGLLLIIKAATT